MSRIALLTRLHYLHAKGWEQKAVPQWQVIRPKEDATIGELQRYVWRIENYRNKQRRETYKRILMTILLILFFVIALV